MEASKIAEILREAGHLHHAVHRLTDGADDDWASWYADWLLNLSELPQLLGTRPVRSHLVHALVELERAHRGSTEPWDEAYARGLVERFASPDYT
jgi:hypothetical protein